MWHIYILDRVCSIHWQHLVWLSCEKRKSLYSQQISRKTEIGFRRQYQKEQRRESIPKKKGKWSGNFSITLSHERMAHSHKIHVSHPSYKRKLPGDYSLGLPLTKFKKKSLCWESSVINLWVFIAVLFQICFLFYFQELSTK